MTFGFTVTVDRDINEVFDAMADARNEPKWNSEVSKSELTSSEPISKGSTFRTVNRGNSYDAVLTSYARPDSLTFDVSGKSFDITGRFDFKAADGGTTVTGSFDMRPKGFMKLMFPLMKPMISKDFPKQGANFKKFCENR